MPIKQAKSALPMPKFGIDSVRCFDGAFPSAPFVYEHKRAGRWAYRFSCGPPRYGLPSGRRPACAPCRRRMVFVLPFSPPVPPDGRCVLLPPVRRSRARLPPTLLPCPTPAAHQLGFNQQCVLCVQQPQQLSTPCGVHVPPQFLLRAFDLLVQFTVFLTVEMLLQGFHVVIHCGTSFW